MKCTSYNNPIYRKVVEGFSMTIEDNESLANDILTTPEFSLDLSGADDLQSVVMDSSLLNFDFYLNLQDTDP